MAYPESAVEDPCGFVDNYRGEEWRPRNVYNLEYRIWIFGNHCRRFAGGELGTNPQVPGKRLCCRIVMRREAGEHVDALSVHPTLRRIVVNRRHQAGYRPVEPNINIERRRLARLDYDAEVETSLFGKDQCAAASSQHQCNYERERSCTTGSRRVQAQCEPPSCFCSGVFL